MYNLYAKLGGFIIKNIMYHFATSSSESVLQSKSNGGYQYIGC